MNNSALNTIQTARRDALVDYYITYCAPQTLLADNTPFSARIKTADELYEYLLLDTQIGPEVITSRVAEAASSLQLYINRCLEGNDPDVDNAVNAVITRESKPGGFLYDWPKYNQVFSTWAGKERLQYYPSTYVDPSLRYNKTELFKALEETINQGRISDERVNKGFQQYLLDFEVLSHLETIGGYQAGLSASTNCQDTLYFVGRSQNAPYTYYWRSCDMSVRDDNGGLTAGAWSQWLKINVPATDTYQNQLMPCWFNNRLYVCWVSKEQVGVMPATTSQPDFTYFSNIWYMSDDGSWVSYKKDEIGRPYKTALVNDVINKKLKLMTDLTFSDGKSPVFCDVLGSYPDKVKEGDVVRFPGGQGRVISLVNTVLSMSFDSSSTVKAVCYNSGGSLIGDATYLNGRFSLFSGTRYVIIVQAAIESGPLYVYCDMVLPLPDYNKIFHIQNNWLQLGTGSTSQLAYLKTSAVARYSQLLQQEGIAGVLNYTSQTALLERDGTAAIDFNGAYGLYFWELFFHSCFLIAERYLTEQNYLSAKTWQRYVFSPAGYRNQSGVLEMEGGKPRYWNVLPLQKDQGWNATIPKTVDPDVIAMNDPMHYKLALFLSSVKTLIEHGDSCYRIQQRDYMAQAKMYYVQAAQMLGPRPQIDYTNSWPNPTLGSEASITLVAAPGAAGQLQAYLVEQNGNFLPPYNADLLMFWDKLEVRLYNLRNNLTLDGQSLVLPLYATEASPTSLQLQQGAGNGTAGGSVPANLQVSEFRFPVLIDKARTAVSSVIQFGNELQSALLQRDNEYMTLLVQTQQQQISTLTQEIQGDNIASLNFGIAASTAALQSANTRLAHYTGLHNNWISSSEQSSMDLRVAAGALNAASLISNLVGAAVEMAPNTFGLACGGSRWGGAARAVGYGLQATATILETSAQRLDISEQYRRRRDEWLMQKENADFEVKQLTAQIASQNQQLVMAQKQKALYAQELSNMQAQYTLQTTRFTGLELFNWITGRLSSLYYQLYDSALALCLTTKAALAREIGEINTASLFTTPVWNDLYQGLLAGESLQLQLQKMENTYLRMDKRGLEIQKTVSLNSQITRADSTKSFSALLQRALSGSPVVATGGVVIKTVNSDKLVIELDVASLRLNGAYGSTGKVGRFKNISVTLPALLGAYQDVEATLGSGTGNYVALSRGLDDSGVFTVDFNDPKYLPFEGDTTNTGTLVLTFFNAGTGQVQRKLVESLVDVIFQLRYTLKGY